MTETLSQAGIAVDAARDVIARAGMRLAELATAGLEGSRAMLEYAEHGEIESMLARAYVADAVSELASRLVGRASTWGSGLDSLTPAMQFVEDHRSPAFLAALGDQ